MSEDGLSEPCDEPSMELFVESLTGTSFEMRVYPTDTVLDIKNKIFRVEGIPVPQQNLLFQMKELNDHSRLSDLGIVNGSTLRLVTAMRGGPISTRRWTSDHMVWKDLKDLIEHTREELGDKLGTKVSVLVFKEGEVIKWLRVIENEDGSYSPYTEQRAIAPPCTSSGSGGGGGGGGCGVSSGGAGSSVGSSSGNKHYQHHKTSATDAATMSSNTIDFQDLMQYKQHAIALSSYYHQHHQHNHAHRHAIAGGSGGSSTLASNSVGEQHHHQLQQHLQQQQQQQQRQQVYRRLEDDVRMKGRVNMLKARMQRAKRGKGKVVAPLEGGDTNGELTAAEEIAIGRRNDSLVLTAVLNDEFIDDDEEGIDEAFKPDLRLEALLRTLQNSESMVGVNGSGTERYTLAQSYHRRTHSRSNNSSMLQLDTSQLPDDDLTLFKPIPTGSVPGHGACKHGTESSAAYLVGTTTNASATTIGNSSTTSTTTYNNSGLNLLLMDCASAETAASVPTNTSTNSSSSGNGVNDLEVALKEKHRSSRLRLHATAAATAAVAKHAPSDCSEDVGKGMKNAVIGRRLSNSIEPTGSSNQINITTAATTHRPSPLPSLESIPTANTNNCYVCTNLHVFEPHHDVIAAAIKCDVSPKRRGSKASAGVGVVSNMAGMTTSGSGDGIKDRLSVPETKRRAKIGRLLNTTTNPGSGETSDSDDGLWSWHTTANAANRLRHYRTTTKRLLLPDTTSSDKGKCEVDGDPMSSMIAMEDYQQQHVILPDIWEHKGSIASPPSPTNNICSSAGGAGGLLCARAIANVSPATTVDKLVASAIADAANAVDDDNGVAAAAAACIRDYMDLDSDFDKMFKEMGSTVSVPSIPSAIPPQYAPKDCQLYLGSPVIPRPGPTPSPTAGESSTAVCSNKSSVTAAAHHRLSTMTTLPYHVHGLCTSPPASGTCTRRSPLYHRRTTAAAVASHVTQSVAAASTGMVATDNDRNSIAATTRSMLEKVQRTADIGNVAGTVGDKTLRQRRRRCSTEDCEFTLERLQNNYVPDRFDYSDFDSCTADVDDLIGRYGQEAIVNARWMEAAAAAAAAASAAAAALSSARSTTSPSPQLPPTTRHTRNSVRLRAATDCLRDSIADHQRHLCLAEQIQRLGIDTDSTHAGISDVTTSVTNTIGARMGVSGRPMNDNTNNTINIREFAHSKFTNTGLVNSSSNNATNVLTCTSHRKLPALVEHRKQQPVHAATCIGLPDPVAVAAPLTRTTAPRMRCAHCNRKLNITNIYDCRCGRIFCAQHRYSEVHDCAHDYKTEGRRLLAQQNPLVTAPKLAKF